jgi:hypothetical protein
VPSPDKATDVEKLSSSPVFDAFRYAVAPAPRVTFRVYVELGCPARPTWSEVVLGPRFNSGEVQFVPGTTALPLVLSVASSGTAAFSDSF